MTEIHGHRGFRGKWPENTITGFVKAIEAAATAIELDVVLSADGKIVVSHEPWMSHKICNTPDGLPVLKEAERNYNIFRMPYSQICLFDCGLRGNPDFPDQHKITAHKPRLTEVIEAAEASLAGTTRQITYNIEVKSLASEEDEFYPSPADMVNILIQEINACKLPVTRFLIQSFDQRILQECRLKAPDITLGLLLEAEEEPASALAKLDFLPDYLNPHYPLVTDAFLVFCREWNLKVVPWTVNDPTVMLKLLRLGVDGIITDFPDLAVEIIKQAK